LEEAGVDVPPVELDEFDPVMAAKTLPIKVLEAEVVDAGVEFAVVPVFEVVGVVAGVVAAVVAGVVVPELVVEVAAVGVLLVVEVAAVGVVLVVDGALVVVVVPADEVLGVLVDDTADR
jgi:hypothetical protein